MGEVVLRDAQPHRRQLLDLAPLDPSRRIVRERPLAGGAVHRSMPHHLVGRGAKGPRLLSAALFGPSFWLVWRIASAMPRLQKQSGGTVGLTTVGMFGKGGG